MICTWSEIFEVEAAVKALGESSAALIKAKPIFADGGAFAGDIDATLARNEACARSFKTWLREERFRRESEDLERKKAGLL